MFSSILTRGVVTGVVTGSGLAAFLSSQNSVYASSENIHALHQDWPHDGFLGAFDKASLRRGYEVYRQVCSTCHSMKQIHFRELIGVTHTEEQAKALAESFEYQNEEPNGEGEMFMRKGKLADKFPSPYPNEEYARFINAGAMPHDLSAIAKARHGGEDYIYALLTGYRDAPAGVNLRPGLHYNPYFPGGAISMAKALQDEGVEWEDGTRPSVSQQAKDVSAFLAWCSHPEYDQRKKTGFNALVCITTAALFAGYWKRFKWSIFKTRKIRFK